MKEKSSPKKKAVSSKKTVISSKKLNSVKKQNKNENVDLFKDYYKEGDRIFLKKPRKFAKYPDLLDLQKRGYTSFINHYLGRLFDNINPVWDIA
jgi:hypothetical protein